MSKAAFKLRPLQPGDAPRITELIGDWDVAQWLSMPPYPYRLADAESFLARVAAMQADAPWVRNEAIIVGDAFAGIIGIDKSSVGPNLGFWLGKPFWGRGIMTTAATALTRAFFQHSGQPLLTSGYFAGNGPSQAIQRRLGFVEISTSTLFNRPHGKNLPHVETTLTRERFEELNFQA